MKPKNKTLNAVISTENANGHVHNTLKRKRSNIRFEEKSKQRLKSNCVFVSECLGENA